MCLIYVYLHGGMITNVFCFTDQVEVANIQAMLAYTHVNFMGVNLRFQCSVTWPTASS